MRLADVPVPVTAAALNAAEVVARFSAPALVNHCHRSYLFAAARAALDGIEVDHELLYVSSLLHDLGLEAPFDSHTWPFEDAGDSLAWVFTAGAGWSAPRRDRAGAIIVAHMRGTDVNLDPEGYLLDVATGLDISGKGAPHWPVEFQREVVAAYPRLDLAPRFTAYFEAQANRKPTSHAAIAVGNGLAARLRQNPLETF